MAAPHLNSSRPSRWTVVSAACLLALAPRAEAEHPATVNATASPAYLQHKFGAAEPLAESYIFMQGRYTEGVTRDRSIERMEFRKIAEYLAPELVRSGFFPTKDLKTADLLLIVHWGTTKPRFTADVRTGFPTVGGSPDPKADSLTVLQSIVAGETDIMGASSTLFDNDPVRETRFDESVQLTDFADKAQAAASNAELLGYTKDLRRFSQTSVPSTEEDTLQANLGEERYFVIVKAYDLREKNALGTRRRAVWSLYVNIRAPGNNFPTALGIMGVAASDYFGRETNGVHTIQPGPRRTESVTLAPLVILGEAK